MTTTLSRHQLASYLALVLLVTGGTAFGQSVPSDFEVIGLAGGLAPTSEYATVRIAADGQGFYELNVPDEPEAPAVESSTFSISQSELGALWQVIQSQDFFGLESEYVQDGFSDRSFAELVVVANGATHTVSTENIAVDPFDAIIDAINQLTPGDRDLVYDTSAPDSFVPTDVCDQPGKRDGSPVSKATGELGARKVYQNGAPHAGTTVANRISLQEAVDLGIVSLSAKGGFYGDQVSITADNSTQLLSDRLDVTLYLEFWGSHASESNANLIEQAIEDKWGGFTTGEGQELVVDVVFRLSPGGDHPPGTPGYHQIELVEKGTSHVHGRGSDFDVNNGVGTGEWRTTGKYLAEMYAHEAGHLLGLPDRYDDYRKQADGDWKRKGDGKVFTPDQLLEELKTAYPSVSEEKLKSWLDKKNRITPPQAGSEDDIMARKTRDPIQSDIDGLAAQAGLIIEIRPGDILVNKNGIEQNFVITRSEDLFVPPGGTVTLDGLYAACIDRWKDTPGAGSSFDVAPSLSDWVGVEAASSLQQLLDYTDRNERYCGGDLPAQWATWRLTDNHLIGDVDAEAYLEEAGIEVGRAILDFPRLSNPNPGNPAATTLIPEELVVPAITPSADIVTIGETVNLSASVMAPSLDGVSVTYDWLLSDAPDGSSASLSADQGEAVSLPVDRRGTYRIELRALVAGNGPVSFSRFTTTHVVAADALTETFESQGPNNRFFWRTTPDQPWGTTREEAHTGEASAASAPIGHSTFSSLQVIFEQATAGELSFAYRVSSEADNDQLLFFVGEELRGLWSGEVDWDVFTTDLQAGTQMITWAYAKDGSRSEGADRAWVDDVVFPENAVFTSIEQVTGEALPGSHELLQNFPNPFDGGTTIGFMLPKPEDVRLIVYDNLGRLVQVLFEGRLNAGHHRYHFEANGLSNGIYHYELRAGSFVERKSMILSK